jgi:hypothetical protein
MANSFKTTTIQQGSGLALRIGANDGSTSLTNATAKAGRFGIPHYLLAEEDVGVFMAYSGDSFTNLTFGGGSSSVNAPTSIFFNTAANNTTTTGTNRMSIGPTGLVRMFFDAQVDGDLAVNGGDLTSSQSAFNLLNTTVATLNIGGAATAVNIGATTGVTAIKNRLRRASRTDTGTSGTVDSANANQVFLNPGSPYNLTTISNGADGDEIVLVNISANTVTVKDGTGNIQCGADVALAANGARMLTYSSAKSAWLMVGNNAN